MASSLLLNRGEYITFGNTNLDTAPYSTIHRFHISKLNNHHFARLQPLSYSNENCEVKSLYALEYKLAAGIHGLLAL